MGGSRLFGGSWLFALGMSLVVCVLLCMLCCFWLCISLHMRRWGCIGAASWIQRPGEQPGLLGCLWVHCVVCLCVCAPAIAFVWMHDNALSLGAAAAPAQPTCFPPFWNVVLPFTSAFCWQ